MDVVDILKKSLAFSLGAAALSAEKIKQLSDEMVARGEMSQDEAKRFVDDVTKKADEEKTNIQNWMREQSLKMLQQAGAAEVARVERLEARVAALELRLMQLTGEVEAMEQSAEEEEEQIATVRADVKREDTESSE